MKGAFDSIFDSVNDPEYIEIKKDLNFNILDKNIKKEKLFNNNFYNIETKPYYKNTFMSLEIREDEPERPIVFLVKNTITNLVKHHALNLLTRAMFLPFGEKQIQFVEHNKKTQILEASRVFKRVQDVVDPVFASKATIFSGFFTPGEHDYIQVKFNQVRSVKKKLEPLQNFLVIKQKRYKLKQGIPVRVKLFRTNIGKPTVDMRTLGYPYLQDFSTFKFYDTMPIENYKLFKKNKVTSELIDAQLARRLLRTRKTLVLPAHVNLTLITNSYDVVHSWFIPILGLKMDCIPGRSTHHSFYVDHIGFFYGQCAEICGRYHHHMPIRLCMLPYEHFFIW